MRLWPVWPCRRQAPVGGKVVEDDDIALCQRWSELRFDVGFEDTRVHRRVDDERGGEPMTAQPGDLPNARTVPLSAVAGPSGSGRAGVSSLSWLRFRR